MPDSCSEFPENPIAWSRSAIEAARDRIVARRGPWTAHSIHLGHDVYTREPEKNWRVELFGRIMHDFGFPQLAGVRILDLGCLEGLFAIEYARQGAVSVGIEGREANIEKAMFARDVLGLTDCTFVQDDVRNLGLRALGQFDVVLCAGILYHLEAEDAIHLIQQVSACCSRLAIFDTHIAPDELRTTAFALSDPMSQVSIDGQVYHGRYYEEHASGLGRDEKAAKLWASLDNEQSFWLSKASLYAALQANGFSGIYDALRDASRPVEDVDRVVFAALK